MKSTDDLMTVFDQSDNVDDVLNEVEDNLTFTQYVNDMMKKYGLTRSDIVKNSQLSKNYCYNILNGRKANTSRDKIISIALAMGLTRIETDHLLTLSGNGALYIKLKRDTIIMFAIDHHYSVDETNNMLFERGYPILDEQAVEK